MHNCWKHHLANVPTNWLILKWMPDFLSSVQLRLQDSGSKLNKRQGPILSERSQQTKNGNIYCNWGGLFQPKVHHPLFGEPIQCVASNISPIQKCASQRNVNILPNHWYLNVAGHSNYHLNVFWLTMIFPSKKTHLSPATISGIRPWGSLGFGEGSCWEEGMVTKKKLHMGVSQK